MRVSVSIKVRSTFVELALYVQNVFSNHPPGLWLFQPVKNRLAGAVWGCRDVQSRFKAIGMILGAGHSKLGLVLVL